MRFLLSIILCLISGLSSMAQTQKSFNRQDSLRGGYGPGRNNWDLLHYELTVRPEFDNKSLSGTNRISLKILAPGHIQIDLQEPMVIDRISLNGQEKKINRDGNVFLIDNHLPNGTTAELAISFHGNPVTAKRPPWDGGWVFKRDKEGKPWMSVACQGLGASCWFPCKDSQADEPDNGCVLHIETNEDLTAVGPGRLIAREKLTEKKIRYSWKVINPINNYNIIPYIGNYVNWKDSFEGEKGKLDLDYWVLAANEKKSKAQFTQVPGMLKAFEHWFGPYPFYEDSYKLVEAPYLGMEHQSGIAYGNGYQNGYSGEDLSGTDVGMKWDFIIVHESGHEWFGNSITSKDIADIWIHESFTSYSEVLYTEYLFGKKDADKYCAGYRKSVDNEFVCIGAYGVQDDPAHRTSDMYAKGSAMLHTIRQICDDDLKFRAMLRDMNQRFYHRTITTKEVENFVCARTGIHKSVFDQYLRSTEIPVLEYYTDKSGKCLNYRWASAAKGLQMKVRMWAGENELWIQPEKSWRKKILSGKQQGLEIKGDGNFYINYKQL